MNQTYVIRVMIVDDHPVVRDGLKSFLAVFDDMELVAEASSGEESLDLCAKANPDVVLMDMRMPGMDGPSTTNAIRRHFPQVQVIALTAFPNEELVQQALEAGAIGFLLKDSSIFQLAEAVRSAYARKPVLGSAALEALVQAQGGLPKLGHDLSERELEVLALVASGFSNVEIGERLGISASTARQHVSSIIAKLGASNRAHAAAQGIRLGLVP